MKYTDANLFAFQDYRLALKYRAEAWKKADPNATFQSLASACRVQKAYLSRVFQSNADLNHDQIFLACDYLGITGLERDFLLTLHDYCRSSITPRRKMLAARLAEQRNQATGTLGHVTVPPIRGEDSERLVEFFLNPDAQLVQTLLMLERYRQRPKSIAAVLGISTLRLEQILDALRRLNLITVTDGGLQVTRSVMHLPVDSPIFASYRSLLRQRVLSEQSRRTDKPGYSLSLLFTADKSVEAAMRERILNVLKDFEVDVRKAPDEDAYFLGIDLWPWTEAGSTP